MRNRYKEFIKIIKRKGFFETIFNSLCIILNKISSYCRIFILKLRGYNIDYSVIFRGSTLFFQSTKKAIKICSNSTIGHNTRITAGQNGRIFVNEGVHIDDYTFIMAHERIEIGKDTAIAPFCFITDFNHKYGSKDLSVMKQDYETKPVLIGKCVWIGTHCIILPGVKIGDGSVIGAGSIVTHDIPGDSIAIGNPARVIKKIKR